MPDYSPATVTTACDAVAHRVVSTQAELDRILKSVDPAGYKVQQLLALSGSLSQLRDAAEHLRSSVAGAAAVSRAVQDVLAESIGPCDRASAIVEKQIGTLEPGFDIDTLDVRIVTEFAAHQKTNAQLFTLIAVLLQIPEPDAQTTKLVALRGRSVLEEAVTASTQVINNSHAPLTTPSPSTPPPDALPPPDYTPSSPGEDSETAEGKKKAPGGFFSSLTHSFKAAASTLMPKPDPLAVAMCQSAKAGTIAHLRAFLAQGVNINGQDDEGYNPLIWATRAGRADVVKFLLDSGADKAAKDSHSGKRKSALFHAAECGHLALVQALLDAGADPRERSWSGQPQFVEVASSARLDIFELFLDRGAEANTVSISGRTVFIHALLAGSLDRLRLLQRYGGDVNARDITGQPALHIALNQDRLDIVDFLLSRGADANVKDLTGSSLLHQAVHKRKYDLARTLLARGANPSDPGQMGKSLLHKLVEASIARGDTSTAADGDIDEEAKLARLVLEKGADPNQYDSWGEHLISHVVDKGETPLLAAFLDRRADANLPFRHGDTLLLRSLARGRVDHARLLLRAGADPNRSNPEKRTPLVEALALDSPGLVHDLLERGADINLAGAVTPAALARLLRNKEVVEMLVAKGAEGPAQVDERVTVPAAQSLPLPPTLAEDEALPTYTPV
ncbi:ankyrin repeat and SAM domain-containing protein [Plectosphaerella plurivora]|uniref:Ankyrin repeat and SAM domain-containing protein n=1 Tax=Plectosphaerella plurivora TaxID=936078 RepID=A0A9P8V4X4_9PEZI|nr:ankyrin repeat and SAM domain-containing protein [Plectosphaerella plurivora]